MAAERKGKVVLAYSGGLDTSVAIPWLHEQGYDVVTLTMHVGQQADNLEEIKAKAYAAGAVKAYVVDLREAFIDAFVWPSLKANAVYQGVYPLNSALSRPMIAQALIWCAEKEGAVAVAHGCTGKGQDQVRIEVACNALNPDVEVLAPVRDWGFSREEEMDYAAAHKVPVPTTRKSPYSIDDNLWGRSIECGILEDPWNKPPEDAYKLTVDPKDAPDEEVYVEVRFENGVPVAVDGKKMSSIELIDFMNKTAGRAGFGRIDMVEDRLVGFKSREVYECPAALSLINAHRKLETLTLAKDTLKTKKELEVRFAEMTYEGYWFSPLMEAVQAFMDSTQKNVNGTVRMKFYKGNCIVDGMKSDSSVYSKALATYSTGDIFDQSASVGFIKIWGMPIKTWRQTHKEKNINPIDALVMQKGRDATK
ncbi:argininosuccinate synthase [Synergistes jonesii]|uniref:argininosuccinate synthase n=1 Tax=Synergistes jonesii TaxID=2754 RepID=UPI00248EA343|nr:argininosuccinate synthase [Synergistes jonesii]